MDLDLTQLKYFLEVKSRGSLTAAAKALGISQPSLSVSIQRLEESFGTTLFLRGRAGVTLTVTGKALASDAEEIFALVRRVEARIAGLEDSDIGRYVLGCHEPLGAYFLPEFMHEFYLQHPRVALTLWNGPSALVRDAVVEREVDFGLVVNPAPHPDLVIVQLFRDAVDFFVAVDEALGPASKRSAMPSREEAIERIRTGTIIHAGRVTESQEVLRALELEGVVPARLLGCGDFELVKSLCLAGVGIGVLPRRVAAYGHPGKLYRLHRHLPHVEDRICLVFRSDAHKTRSAVILKDALIAHGKVLNMAKLE